jgi:hypothetical protein
MRRRKFLSTTAAGAIALLVDGEPVRLSTEGLTLWRADLDHLRRVLRTESRGAIAVPVARQAEGLVRMLHGTPESARMYRPLAELTAETAMLAGWAMQDQEEHTAAANWSRVAVHASRQARNPDLLAMALEDWAWVMNESFGRRDDALRLLDQIPLKQIAPSTRATVGVGRAMMFARTGRTNASLAVLDDIELHANTGTAPGRLTVDANRVQSVRGYTFVDLGFAAPAYEQLTEVRRLPHQWISQGLVELNLATAAAQMGEVEQACRHAAEAHAVFTEARSTHQARKVLQLRERQLDRYADTRAVRELDDYLRTAAEGGQRYVVTRSRHGKEALHRADCPYMLRGAPSVKRRTWTGGNGRTPAGVAADDDVRAAFDVCKLCMH